MTGASILASTLKNEGVRDVFFLMGEPMLAAEALIMRQGIRAVDVRHEQAAALMATAYARLTSKVGVCLGSAGPGAVNLASGIAHAWVEGAPVLAIAGSTALADVGKGSFQEFDQIALFRSITKSAFQVSDASEIPDVVEAAFAEALRGPPGPVYVDLPADVLNAPCQLGLPKRRDAVSMLHPELDLPDAGSIQAVHELLNRATRPVLITGSGIFWSEASAEVRTFVERTGIPVFTTPQGRGVIPEDHEFSFPFARSVAFRNADLVIVVGTRLNYVVGYLAPPKFNPEVKVIRVDIDPSRLGETRPPDVGIVGDARVVMREIANSIEDGLFKNRYSEWRGYLSIQDAQKRRAAELLASTEQVPIHPLRLCREVRDFLHRDAVLVVDGQEILHFARHTIPTFRPRHRLNSGAFGTMGVGLPFGLGACVALPDKQVVILHGDGSFGFHAMELDTAVRHGLRPLIIISLNGGWTADPLGNKPGRNLGYTRFHELAASLGCDGELVERPSDVRAALERAKGSAGPYLINVVTDWRAVASRSRYSNYRSVF